MVRDKFGDMVWFKGKGRVNSVIIGVITKKIIKEN